MTQKFLAQNSPYTYIWHDNSGQRQADNDSHIQCTVNADGISLDIAANAVIVEPIIIINSAANGNKSKNVINLAQGAQVQLIEYLMSDDPNAQNIISTVINCGNNSQLKHCVLQDSSIDTKTSQQSTTLIKQAADSKVVSHVFAFGPQNKVELGIALDGHNAQSHVNYLAYTIGSEIQNVMLKIDHLKPNCTSSTLVRGILKDKSNTELGGKIIVHPNARKTIADLQIKNIICSPKAQANNKPELEIFNDDVRCSHGSSTGQLDEDALFYMRSRGLDRQAAIALLIEGFIRPVIDSCTIPQIAEYINGIIAGR